MKVAWRLALVTLTLASCKGGKVQSIVLSGEVSDYPGDGPPTCPWDGVDDVEISGDTVSVSGRPYTVTTEAAAGAFVSTLELCGHADAVAPFRAWRTEARKAKEREKQADSSINLAPSTDEVTFTPVHERQPEDAWVTDYKPGGPKPTLAGPKPTNADPVAAARDAFLEALQGP